MASNLIERIKMVDPNTGEAIPVDVRTCAAAVVCDEGHTLQEHVRNHADHVADAAAHPSATKRAEWDAKETTSGAQTKADKAVADAVTRATTIAENAKEAAITQAASDATDKANNAKADAIREAAADATAKVEALIVGTDQIAAQAVTADKIKGGAINYSHLGPACVSTSNMANASVTAEKIRDGAVTEEKIADGILPVDKVIAQGTSGDWTYRKWSSGRIEAWADVTIDITLDSSFSISANSGNLFLLGGTVPEQTIPESAGFTGAPAVICSPAGAYAVWLAPGSRASAVNKTPEIAVSSWGTLASTDITLRIAFYCFGR